MVPTVDLGLCEVDFCWIEIDGERPSIDSISALSITDRNCLAYVDKDSTYLLCPSAYIVSKAREDFPDPDRPVITVSLSLGILRDIFFKLCAFAPLISINFKLIT